MLDLFYRTLLITLWNVNGTNWTIYKEWYGTKNEYEGYEEQIDSGKGTLILSYFIVIYFDLVDRIVKINNINNKTQEAGT